MVVVLGCVGITDIVVGIVIVMVIVGVIDIVYRPPPRPQELVWLVLCLVVVAVLGRWQGTLGSDLKPCACFYPKFQVNPRIIIKIQIHSSCEIEYFVELCNSFSKF